MAWRGLLSGFAGDHMTLERPLSSVKLYFFIVKGLSVNPGILLTRSDFSAPEISGGGHRNRNSSGYLQVFL